ncbi:hypothetical protein BUALT_Bualt06G0043200 [Buddleja alternifolia]|uniref:C2 NT-type domain-containing protein n=1 Tax=Buddleja alternifolia TaxID=168488 RepID=A0AAV6XNT4_9LAMI|nr:hypothetical protein BUALT_Bualt06G0043200 [Buddleja alternifolia]
MVVKMIKWRRGGWASKKYEAKITIHQLTVTSTDLLHFQVQPDYSSSSKRFSVEIKWRGGGSKGIISSLRRRRKGWRRNFTKEECLREDGMVEWNDEEFRCVSTLSPAAAAAASNNHVFHPWHVSLALFIGLKQGTNNNAPIVGTASLNLADFAGKQHHTEINIPLTTPENSSATLNLSVSVVLRELKNAEKPSESMPRPMLSFPRSPCYGEMFSTDKEDNISTRKASPIRVNIFKGLSALRAKRTSHEEEVSSDERSSDIEFNSPLDTDSLDDSDEEESEEVKEDSCVWKSFNYGTLASANRAGASIQSNMSSSEDEDLIYYSHCKSDVGQTYNVGSVSEHSTDRNRKRGLIPWRKRKLSFTSPKVKGEPLLKKDYREDGGDDIDFDRRQLSSSDESTLRQKTGENSVVNQPSASEFGDDNFVVGVWEKKEIISRDGEMKLKTQVFFASIDQRSERAAGESACTALVAVIADWLQSNHKDMPIKSQLDTLIREGSLEWRNLCENESYREKFPDKHFDLETVLEAKIRPLYVVPQKSFVGFFQPEGVEDQGFDFLQGAMSFDNIWDEISRCESEISLTNDPLVYIISWNDHFFILKVEKDAYYIIDTLGERLYEGCNQAFILKFDTDTIIHRETQKSDDKAEQNEIKEVKVVVGTDDDDDVTGKKEEESTIVCTGKESCKEYIKSFLAAIPIRELEVDLKKGLMASTTPLHHRLQIEFHYTMCLAEEVIDDKPSETLPLAANEPDELQR